MLEVLIGEFSVSVPFECRCDKFSKVGWFQAWDHFVLVVIDFVHYFSEDSVVLPKKSIWLYFLPLLIQLFMLFANQVVNPFIITEFLSFDGPSLLIHCIWD